MIKNLMDTANFQLYPENKCKERISPSILSFINVQDVENVIKKTLKACSLPEKHDSCILLKPNCNNEMNAMMGGTTDLRIINSVLKYLKNYKYNNIIIGDGPNCGCFHDGIDVFKRLKIDLIAKKYNVKLVNFNQEEKVEIELDGRKAEIAKICLERDFMINIPKIKTHSEFVFTCCTKNLMGCLSGFDKRKAHYSMVTNLLKLNEVIHPDYHIVDGLIAMEDKGPNAGTPKKLGMIVAGKNPFQLDAYCCQIINQDWRQVPYLVQAAKKGLFSKSQNITVPKDVIIQDFKIAPMSATNAFVNILYGNTFVMARYSKMLDPFFSMNFTNDLLFKLGIKQERYLKNDDRIESFKINQKKCTHCKKCSEYCPLGLDVEKISEISDCIKCAYCYIVCPNKAISIEGSQGFLKPYLKKISKFRGCY